MTVETTGLVFDHKIIYCLNNLRLNFYRPGERFLTNIFRKFAEVIGATFRKPKQRVARPNVTANEHSKGLCLNCLFRWNSNSNSNLQRVYAEHRLNVVYHTAARLKRECPESYREGVTPNLSNRKGQSAKNPSYFTTVDLPKYTPRVFINIGLNITRPHGIQEGELLRCIRISFIFKY